MTKNDNPANGNNKKNLKSELGGEGWERRTTQTAHHRCRIGVRHDYFRVPRL